MGNRQSYPNIDMQRTGKRIRYFIESAGYTPKMIQEYLHLSCVQPIYRWYKGLILPSVDHLFMLSELLGVHMEDLLVKKNALTIHDIDMNCLQKSFKRFERYADRINKLIA